MRVGVHLALGKPKPVIAKELGIKLSSVEDAARKLYERLDIHTAGELGTLLWTADSDTLAARVSVLIKGRLGSKVGHRVAVRLPAR